MNSLPPHKWCQLEVLISCRWPFIHPCSKEMISFFVMSLSWWPGVFFKLPVPRTRWLFVNPNLMWSLRYRQQPSPQHPEVSSPIPVRIFGLQTLKPILSSGTRMRFLALVLTHCYEFLNSFFVSSSWVFPFVTNEFSYESEVFGYILSSISMCQRGSGIFSF